MAMTSEERQCKIEELKQKVKDKIRAKWESKNRVTYLRHLPRKYSSVLEKAHCLYTPDPIHKRMQTIPCADRLYNFPSHIKLKGYKFFECSWYNNLYTAIDRFTSKYDDQPAYLNVPYNGERHRPYNIDTQCLPVYCIPFGWGRRNLSTLIEWNGDRGGMSTMLATESFTAGIAIHTNALGYFTEDPNPYESIHSMGTWG